MLATLSLSFAWAPWPLIAPRADECPAVTTVGSANFNLTEYVRKSWYIQAQQVESYQPLDSLYCVTATYDLDGATVPFFRGTVVTVYNYGNKGAVNGPNVNKNNMTLCARATNASDTSRLAVAPCFLPNLAAGPYWLLGVGADIDATQKPIKKEEKRLRSVTGHPAKYHGELTVHGTAKTAKAGDAFSLGP